MTELVEMDNKVKFKDRIEEKEILYLDQDMIQLWFYQLLIVLFC